MANMMKGRYDIAKEMKNATGLDMSTCKNAFDAINDEIFYSLSNLKVVMISGRFKFYITERKEYENKGGIVTIDNGKLIHGKIKIPKSRCLKFKTAKILRKIINS